MTLQRDERQDERKGASGDVAGGTAAGFDALLDGVVDRLPHADIREGVLDAVLERREAPPSGRRWQVGAVILAAAAAVLFLVTRPAPLSTNEVAEIRPDAPSSPPGSEPADPEPVPAALLREAPPPQEEPPPRRAGRARRPRPPMAAEPTDPPAPEPVVTADTLLREAEAEGLAGHAERAAGLYRSVRERFPRSVEAGLATFQLGRLASERGAHLEAASHFARYRARNPSGALAREAAGRLLEARVSIGEAAATARAARDYLRQFPDGPHAPLARRALSR